MSNVDLTKLQVPFGLLDKETQDALRAWEHGLQRFFGYEWVDCGFGVPHLDATYRARPAPLVPDSIDWSHVAPEWKFMARDEDGTPWTFKEKPKADHHPIGGSWEEQSKGSLLECKGSAWNFASYKRGTVAWQDSLVARPVGGEASQ